MTLFEEAVQAAEIYFPAVADEQIEHAPSPAEAAKEPEAHGVQDAAEPPAKVPARHSTSPPPPSQA